MADQPNKGPAEEAKAPEKAADKPKQAEIQEENIDVSEGAADFVEGIDGEVEGEGSGEISEKKEGIGEHRQSTGGKFQQFSKNMTDEEAAKLKKKLLQKPPTKREMVSEIRAHIHKEILVLNKKAKRARRKGHFRELAESVRRTRELKRLLANLFTATAELIKNTWLKVVHGIV